MTLGGAYAVLGPGAKALTADARLRMSKAVESPQGGDKRYVASIEEYAPRNGDEVARRWRYNQLW